MINYVGITKIKTISSNQDAELDSACMAQCHLKWRNKMLVVSTNPSLGRADVIALKSDWWLVNCLQKSPVKRIRVSQKLGGVGVKNWVLAGEKTNKQVFLRTSSDLNLSILQKTWAWKTKRIIDCAVAMLVLLLLSPVGLAIALKHKLSGQPVLEKRWCVGRRGLIFRTFGWAQNNSNNFWSRQGSKFGLHKLPQLINVLRGEMSLVGHYPFSLDEALDLNTQQRKVLNTVPGIISTTPWRSPRSDLRAISAKSYHYLCHWSLISDLKILLLILPRLFQGKDSTHKTIKL